MSFARAAIPSIYVAANSSRVSQLMAPEEVEMRDVQTSLGNTRIFWLRKIRQKLNACHIISVNITDYVIFC